MRIELNRLRDYVGRNLLCVAHSDRTMDGSNDINRLEERYGSPARLPPLQPFATLRPCRELVPYLGTISLYDIGDAGDCRPELVCAFRPTSYKPQHGLWDGDRLWVLGAEHIEAYDAGLNSLMTIRDPWLAGAHTIAGDGRGHLVVSCSGSDSVLIVDAGCGAIVGAHRMPEDLYGVNYPLARHDSVAEHYIINDYQLTHVNCAWPWRGGVLTSSKIQGALGWFDAGAQYHELLRGFVGCHGARVRSDVEEIYFCDSCTGMLVFMDARGSIVRRIGTGSRWLHDAIQIDGDVFAAAPFDQHEVIILDAATRRVISRIACGDRGGPERLSFGIPRVAFGASADDHELDCQAPVAVSPLSGGRGPMTDTRETVAAALHRQQAAMVRARDATFAAHREELGARDALIASLREKHAGLQAEINRRDRLLCELHATMPELQHAVGLAQEETNRRDRMLVELNQAMQQETNRRDRMLVELNRAMQEEIDRRDRLLDEAARSLSARVSRLVQRVIGGLTRLTSGTGSARYERER